MFQVVSKILGLALTVLSNPPRSAASSLRASPQSQVSQSLTDHLHGALLEKGVSFHSLVSFKKTFVELLLPAAHPQAPGPRARAGMQEEKRHQGLLPGPAHSSTLL